MYVALGDSLATGAGATVPDQLGYVPHFFADMRSETGNSALQLRNLSVSGETSQSLISGGQLAAALSAIADPASDVRVVTLDIGGDDLLPLLAHPLCSTSPAGEDCRALTVAALTGFEANFPRIVGQLTAALADDPGPERLLVMTYYNPFSGTRSEFEAPVDRALRGSDATLDCADSDPATAGLNGLIACIATDAGATVVDLYPLFEGRGAELTHILQEDVASKQRWLCGDRARSPDGFIGLDPARLRPAPCQSGPALAVGSRRQRLQRAFLDRNAEPCPGWQREAASGRHERTRDQIGCQMRSGAQSVCGARRRQSRGKVQRHRGADARVERCGHDAAHAVARGPLGNR
jgi:lysophospholipase L1-like esterase